MLIVLYNAPMKTVDTIPELLRWFEGQYADPSLPGGILRKVVHFGNPIRVQYFVHWPAPPQNSPTSEKAKRTHNRASRVRVIRG